jgi:O-antigen/teichoic acid export membrane protein
MQFSRKIIGLTLRVFYAGATFLVGVTLARLLSPEDYGQYAYVYAWLMVGVGLVQAGFPVFIVREVATYFQAGRYDLIRGLLRWSNLAIFFLGSIFIGGVLIINQFHFSGLKSSSLRQMFLVGAFMIPIIVLSVKTEAATRGLGYTLIGQAAELLVRPVSQLSLLLVFAWGVLPWPLTPQSAIWTALAASISALITSLIVYFCLLPKEIGESPISFDFSNWSKNIGKITLFSWINVINQQFMIIFLGLISQPSDVAEYRVALQLAMVIPLGLTVAEMLYTPRLSQAYDRGDFNEMQNIAVQLCRFSLAISIPISFVLLFLGYYIIIHVYGVDYLGSIIPVFILVLGYVAGTIFGSVGILLYVSRNEWDLIASQFALLILSGAAACLLVPQFGAIGAAAAHALGMTCYNIALFYRVLRKINIVSLPVGVTMIREIPLDNKNQ